MAHIRQDVLHKLTTHLATTCGTVVVEHRNVAGMARGRRAKSVYDAGMAGIRRPLRYRHLWYESAPLAAAVHYPSSKRCSARGAVKADLPLWERTYRCEACGRVLDRDWNASHRLAALAAAVAGSGPQTQNARGGDGRPGAAGQTSGEAGTRHGGHAPRVRPAPLPGNGWMQDWTTDLATVSPSVPRNPRCATR